MCASRRPAGTGKKAKVEAPSVVIGCLILAFQYFKIVAGGMLDVAAIADEFDKVVRTDSA